MKKYFELMIFLCSSFMGIAQNNLPPVYEIKSDPAVVDILPNNYRQLPEDKDGKYSFAEVRGEPLVNNFHYITTINPGDHSTIHGYWLRFVLQNTMDHVAKISFGDPESIQMDQSDFYFINKDNEITRQVSGYLTPWSKLNGIKEYRIIPIELKPDEKIVVYTRIFNSYHFGFPFIRVAFGSTEKIMQSLYTQSNISYFNAIHDTFIFGVLAFAGLFI